MLTHKEIELKFPLTEDEYQSLIARLSQKFERTDLDQNDFVVKLKSGENVRVRIENGRALMTHKKKIHDKQGNFLYCCESESVIDTAHMPEITAMFKALGTLVPDPDVCANVDLFREFVENVLAPQTAYRVHLHKNRMEFKAGKNCTYVVDEVENLGHFLEIELLEPLNDTKKESVLRSKLRQKLPELGLLDRENTIDGYTVLMHEKQKQELALTDAQKEALNFYQRSHYLIVNNLLCQKFDTLVPKMIGVVNDNDKGMIKEALEQGKAKRFCTDEEWGARIFNAYVRRTTDGLSPKEIKKHIQIAAQDVREINAAMKPTDRDLIVFRKVHLPDHFNSCRVGEEKEISCFSSTTLDPNKYEAGDDVVLYKIKVPKGTPVIRVDLLDETLANEYFGWEPQNEKEVLLPPLRCKISKVDSCSKEKVKGQVDMVVTGTLDVLQILKNALMALNKFMKRKSVAPVFKHFKGRED